MVFRSTFVSMKVSCLFPRITLYQQYTESGINPRFDLSLAHTGFKTKCPACGANSLPPRPPRPQYIPHKRQLFIQTCFFLTNLLIKTHGSWTMVEIYNLRSLEICCVSIYNFSTNIYIRMFWVSSLITIQNIKTNYNIVLEQWNLEHVQFLLKLSSEQQITILIILITDMTGFVCNTSTAMHTQIQIYSAQ